jgi:hypothetical protein
VADDGILLKDEITTGYCHMKFPAIREGTLGSDHPVLKDPRTGDIIDFSFMDRATRTLWVRIKSNSRNWKIWTNAPGLNCQYCLTVNFPAHCRKAICIAQTCANFQEAAQQI